MLGIFSCITLIIVLNRHVALKSLGLRVDNFRKGVVPYVVFTFVGVMFLITLAKLLKFGTVSNWSEDIHFIFLFLPISALQEFMYRGFLMSELHKLIHSVYLVIFTNTLLFGLLHIFYSNAMIMLPLALISGFAFALMYQRYPNIYLISCSHAILNFTATVLSFFSI